LQKIITAEDNEYAILVAHPSIHCLSFKYMVIIYMIVQVDVWQSSLLASMKKADNT
jgi:hypothetical protein